MATTAQVMARTLHEAGVERLFGLPGGEILDVIEAARQIGLPFLLTRHEATASLMADVTGQITRRPGVCVSTLGPGAVNMTLGVANAYLDHSPLIAITATLARSSFPVATHQDLDLNAVYRPLTKFTITLDGQDTAAKVRHAIAVATTPRMGPVHVAIPADVARSEERETGSWRPQAAIAPVTAPAGVAGVASLLRAARRPVLILGLDLNPRTDDAAVRAFAEALGAPVFVTPKAKGLFPEDHPQFYGVCAGVAADAVVLRCFARSDLLLGVGFDPIESDKLWHATMPIASVGPLSIATREFRPKAEAIGDVRALLPELAAAVRGAAFEWTPDERRQFREDLEDRMQPTQEPQGLSGFELTRRLREWFPRNTILATDVGSVKMVTSQAWMSYEPLTFFESNGLSTMSYALPAAMAARLQFPDRPILCTMGDGGFSMTMAEIETCVREGLHFVTVIYNDSSLSLIDVAQRRKNYPTAGVKYGSVDFAAASAALGAWSRRVETMAELDEAIMGAMRMDRVAVIEAVVDPSEYHQQMRRD